MNQGHQQQSVVLFKASNFLLQAKEVQYFVAWKSSSHFVTTLTKDTMGGQRLVSIVLFETYREMYLPQ